MPPAGSLEPMAPSLLGLSSVGERIALRHPDRQGAEIHIRIALMHRFDALGTVGIRRVA